VDSIHLPNAIALPNAFGAPGAPLPPGQVVQALVLALIDSDVFRLQVPQAVLDVRSDVALTPGSTVTLAVKSGGPNPTLVVYSDASAAAPAGQRAAANIAGRQPIGEAVVIARAPAQGAIPARPALPAQVTTLPQGRAAEPAVLRDAPSISPAQPLVRPPVAPAIAASPQQAIGEAVRVAASRQSGLAPLFADVEQVIQLSNTLPAPVRAAANELLSVRVPLYAQITAADMKQAFVRSGVLLETRLAATSALPRAAPIAAPQSSPLTSAPAPSEDLKAALLVFRQVLKTWIVSEPVVRLVPSIPAASVTAEVVSRSSPPETDATIKILASALAGPAAEAAGTSTALSAEQATALAKTVATALSTREPQSAPSAAITSSAPPPYRGAPLAAQPPVASSIAPDAAPHEIADRLIAQTDGALARQTLLQVASLPDQPGMPRADAAQRWTFEIPFATPQGTSIAQFEVSRDGRAAKSDSEARTWRARFSLDAEPMGPVHALIALAGERTSVTLWAERKTTATQLQENAPLLKDALRAAELAPADFQLRVGAPPVAARQPTPGRFMDRAS